MDDFLRKLQKAAASGDPDAVERLEHYKKKVGPSVGNPIGRDLDRQVEVAGRNFAKSKSDALAAGKSVRDQAEVGVAKWRADLGLEEALSTAPQKHLIREFNLLGQSGEKMPSKCHNCGGSHDPRPGRPYCNKCGHREGSEDKCEKCLGVGPINKWKI